MCHFPFWIAEYKLVESIQNMDVRAAEEASGVRGAASRDMIRWSQDRRERQGMIWQGEIKEKIYPRV